MKTYLPKAGTLGQLDSFYDIFSYNAPYVPVVPYKGPDDELFFDRATQPPANEPLIRFRNRLQDMI